MSKKDLVELVGEIKIPVYMLKSRDMQICPGEVPGVFMYPDEYGLPPFVILPGSDKGNGYSEPDNVDLYGLIDKKPALKTEIQKATEEAIIRFLKDCSPEQFIELSNAGLI